MPLSCEILQIFAGSIPILINFFLSKKFKKVPSFEAISNIFPPFCNFLFIV